MSVKRVSPAWRGGEYVLGIDGRTAVSVYQVDVSDPYRDDEETAAGARGIPREGSRKGRLTALNVTARREGAAMFRVTIRWAELNEQAQMDLGRLPDPFSVPEQRWWDFETTVEPYDVDADGRPVLNSAGEPLDPPPTMEITDLVLNVIRAEPLYDWREALMYARSCNSDDFYGFAAGCARAFVTGELVRGEQFAYWRKTYRVRFRHPHADAQFGGWEDRFLDHGHRVLARDPTTGRFLLDDKGGPVYRAITQDGSNMPISQPALLDGGGELLRKGRKAVWLHFKPRFFVPYKKLNI